MRMPEDNLAVIELCLQAKIYFDLVGQLVHDCAKLFKRLCFYISSSATNVANLTSTHSGLRSSPPSKLLSLYARMADLPDLYDIASIISGSIASLAPTSMRLEQHFQLGTSTYL